MMRVCSSGHHQLLQACRRPLSRMRCTRGVVANRECLQHTPCISRSYTTVGTTNPLAQNEAKLWQTEGVFRPVPTELLLKKALEELFPDEKMIYNGRKVHNIKMPNSPQSLEIDVCIPRYNLFIEYQDPHHFTTVWYCHRTLESIKETDDFKKQAIESKGHTLIQVPCWWDGQPNSLAATIKSMRPDLLQHITPSSPPISTKIPEKLFRTSEIPGVGELMAPCFMSTVTTSNWWLGEKYDGMRCCWNPETKQLYTRSAAVIPLPESLKTLMPNEFIDGEIWGGRGHYLKVAKLNPIHKSTIDWKDFRLVAFDVPNPRYIENKTPFEERYQRLLSVINPSHSFIIVASRLHLHSVENLSRIVEDIMHDNGEGVILRQMRSPYEKGRSNVLGKIKIAKDTEALVIGGDAERLTLQLPDGTRFNAPVPIQTEIEGQLPKLNDVVTFKFKRFSNGTIPVNPKIQRVREDLTWDEVVAKHSDFDLKTHLENNKRWSGTKADMRRFFEEYAKNSGFDPLNPVSWYSVQRNDITSIKGAAHMLRSNFNGSVVTALLNLFPEIGLDKLKFQIVPHHYWKDIQNVRNYFLNLAQENGLDPLVADSWYNFPFYQAKKIRSIAHYYSYPTALAKAFPEIKFEDKFQFQREPNHSLSEAAAERRTADKSIRWSGTRTDMRNLFEEYARSKNLDPLNPGTWYKTRRSDILAIKGAAYMLRNNFNGSIVEALLYLFPEIGLDKLKFQILPPNYWNESQHIREYFVDLAKQRGFDPLVPDNWYQFPFHQAKKIRSIRRRFTFPTALETAFPEVKFDLSQFHRQRNFAIT